MLRFICVVLVGVLLFQSAFVVDTLRIRQTATPKPIPMASPTVVDEQTAPTVVDEQTEPTVVDEQTEPTVVDEQTEPTVVDEQAEQTVVDEKTKPIGVCKLPEETGRCRMYILSWYYDTTEESCKSFVYGGCGGNGNRFESEEECSKKCE